MILGTVILFNTGKLRKSEKNQRKSEEIEEIQRKSKEN